jgi:hypothetical protein
MPFLWEHDVMNKTKTDYHQRLFFWSVIVSVFFVTGCAHMQKRTIETTAYCGCKQCCGWDRGSWKFLKLDFWNAYYVSGPDKGKPYHGHTARGTEPRQYQPGLVSLDSVTHPWLIPVRIVFPWLWLPQPGTIAADTHYYPFGTVMIIPGYGKGIVEDHGSAIKGAKRIDLYFTSHDRAQQWGRQTLPVKIKK